MRSFVVLFVTPPHWLESLTISTSVNENELTARRRQSRLADIFAIEGTISIKDF
jgi:hypothetical protein